MELNILKVTWKDAESSAIGWMDAELEFKQWSEDGLAQIESVGILTYENDEYIILTQSLAPGPKYAESVKIIKKNIINRTELYE
jgi:hypothetical protein